MSANAFRREASDNAECTDESSDPQKKSREALHGINRRKRFLARAKTKMLAH